MDQTYMLVIRTTVMNKMKMGKKYLASKSSQSSGEDRQINSYIFKSAIIMP